MQRALGRLVSGCGVKPDALTPDEALKDVETQIDAGTYRPGPWAAFLAGAFARPRVERLALASAVTRISDKLHRKTHA